MSVLQKELLPGLKALFTKVRIAENTSEKQAYRQEFPCSVATWIQLLVFYSRLELRCLFLCSKHFLIKPVCWKHLKNDLHPLSYLFLCWPIKANFLEEYLIHLKWEYDASLACGCWGNLRYNWGRNSNVTCWWNGWLKQLFLPSFNMLFGAMESFIYRAQLKFSLITVWLLS